MPPSSSRKQDDSPNVLFSFGECSLGDVLIASLNDADSAGRVCFLSLGDEPSTQLVELAAAFPNHELIEAATAFESELTSVIEFVEQPKQSLNFPLTLRGTVFQKRVWNALKQTRPGETVTYRELAQRIGSPGSSRAVGAACGQNQIALAIPCHRAVRCDGKDSGFRWGLDRKRELLTRERSLSGQSGSSHTNQLSFAGFDSVSSQSNCSNSSPSTRSKQTQT